MRGMKLTETIGLVVISLLIVATTGCGNKEGKYVGTYVEEPKEVGPPGVTRRLRTVLELASDGTYKLTQGDIDHPSVTTGEWSVGKSGGEEYVEFIPFIGYSASRSKTRGYYFHDAPLGQTILAKEKQARSSQSTERIPDAAQDPISAAHRQLSYFEVALDALIDGRQFAVAALQLFNHGTHHRGQLTTLLRQAGHDPGATDIPWLPGVVRIVDTP